MDRMAITQSGLPRAVVKAVEWELRHLEVYRKTAQLLREELVELRECFGVQAGAGPKVQTGLVDRVGRQAVKLVDLEDKLRVYELKLRALDAGVAVLGVEERALVELRYFHPLEYNHEQTMTQLGWNRNRYYRLRGSAIAKVALVLGYDEGVEADAGA